VLADKFSLKGYLYHDFRQSYPIASYTVFGNYYPNTNSLIFDISIPILKNLFIK